MNLKDRTRWAINYISAKYKLSNPKIAKHLGVKNDTVNSYRAKLSNPKVDFIVKLCDAFDIDLIWFTKGDGEPFPGASIKYPEVCSQTGYEIARNTNPETGITEDASSDHDAKPVIDKGNISPTEESFRRLSELAEISIERGWKTKLAGFLDISLGQISNSILRGKISNNLMRKIEERGFEREKWVVSDEIDTGPASQPLSPPVDVEISFQKLAILAGIRIGQNWLLDLASLIGLDALELRGALRCGKINKVMMKEIESKGFDEGLWVVRKKTPKLPNSEKQPIKTNELLEMAARILESGSSFATVFALNIEAFYKGALEENILEQQGRDNQG